MVTHNKKLSVEFDCHINVEVIATNDTPKYLYKYCYKGLDMSHVDWDEETDTKGKYNEPKKFIEGRYVCFNFYKNINF